MSRENSSLQRSPFFWGNPVTDVQEMPASQIGSAY